MLPKQINDDIIEGEKLYNTLENSLHRSIKSIEPSTIYSVIMQPSTWRKIEVYLHTTERILSQYVKNPLPAPTRIRFRFPGIFGEVNIYRTYDIEPGIFKIL